MMEAFRICIMMRAHVLVLRVWAVKDSAKTKTSQFI